MDTSFEATTSPIFTLPVGTDKKEAFIHSDMLANASDVLSVLVRGDMKEAREKRAEWSHVDEETFSRFFQFVYGKDYIVPSPIVLSTPEEHDDSHPKNGETNPSPDKYEWKRCFSLQENWPEFGPVYIQKYEDHHCVDDDFPNAQNTWQPAPNYANQDWAPFFIKQVQLYVVADMYLVEPLIRLVLLRTYSFLRQFELLETDVDSVIEFIYFVYENTAPRYGDRVDPMRDLVACYVAVVARGLEKHEAFTQLLEDHGGFAADLWRSLPLPILSTRPIIGNTPSPSPPHLQTSFISPFSSINRTVSSSARRFNMNGLIMNGALRSPIFTFLVGTDKREIKVHSDIISSASPVLNALVNGGMRESKEKLVDWSHFDETTFNRFCEFLYSGDYTVPSPLLDFALPTQQNDTFQPNDAAGFNTEQAAAEQPTDHDLATDHGLEDLSIRPIMTSEQYEWKPESLQQCWPELGRLEISNHKFLGRQSA